MLLNDGRVRKLRNILFVCTGNTCRSAMAEAITSDYIKRRGIDAAVCSRGINVIYPTGATPEAIEALQRRFGIDLSEHRSRQLCADDMEAADIVLVMTKAHRSFVIKNYPQHAGKVSCVCGYAGFNHEDISDPYGKPLSEYINCAEQLERCIVNMRFLDSYFDELD